MPAPIAPSPANPTRSISLNIGSPHLPGGVLHRLDDPQIAGAAAEVARQRLAQVLLPRIRILTQHRLHRHQEPRGAEPALERVRLVERALERVQLALRREALHGPDRAAVCLGRQHQARPDRLAVELDRARAAHALLASDLRAGQPRAVADEVGQERARLHVALVGVPVDLDADPQAIASTIARQASSVQSARRWSPSTSWAANSAASRGSAPPAHAPPGAPAPPGTGPAPRRA